MRFDIEYEIEDDGRWIAEIPSMPGVMVYGKTQKEAASKVIELAIKNNNGISILIFPLGQVWNLPLRFFFLPYKLLSYYV
ncbi:MAG: type II toxin-antitoxin system HicB family antitoxin [bacterium]